MENIGSWNKEGNVSQAFIPISEVEFRMNFTDELSREDKNLEKEHCQEIIYLSGNSDENATSCRKYPSLFEKTKQNVCQTIPSTVLRTSR
jgi:hypothetical protein